MRAPAFVVCAVVLGCGAPRESKSPPTASSSAAPSPSVTDVRPNVADVRPNAADARPSAADVRPSATDEDCAEVEDVLVDVRSVMSAARTPVEYQAAVAAIHAKGLPLETSSYAKLAESLLGAAVGESAARARLTTSLVPAVRPYLIEANGSIYLTLPRGVGRAWLDRPIGWQSTGQLPDGPTAVTVTRTGPHDLVVIATSGGRRECVRVTADPSEACVPGVVLSHETVVLVLDAGHTRVEGFVRIQEGEKRVADATRVRIADDGLLVDHKTCKQRYALATGN